MSETIYALASAPGRAGVAVIRISGRQTAQIVEQLAGRLPPQRQASLCALRHNGEQIDKGLVLWFAGPASYTGEDMAELHLHGGRAVLAAISQALTALGARLAEPGEFTRRAVTNGKLDLTEAEGVADLVDAETQAQRKQALRQLGGELRALYDGWRGQLTHLQAHLEASIDFADDDLPPDLQQQTQHKLHDLLTQMQAHLADAHRGERLRAGVYAAIIGAPNAGKSSLLNQLAQRDVAIVTPIAGTTRDVLEVQLDVGGYPLTLADTAGLREASDAVEQEGIRRALARAAEADFKLLVFDASAGEVPDFTTLAQYVPGDLLIINKADEADTSVLKAALKDDAIEISAKTGVGLPDLLSAMRTRLDELVGLSPAPVLTRARHRAAVEETIAALQRALEPKTIDMVAEDVRLASRALGRITGQVGVEDLLDVIFRDFCLGK